MYSPARMPVSIHVARSLRYGKRQVTQRLR